ncbi:ThiF family adenylyltransferase [Halococcus sediminicola]|uniref:ThiF family adenylyltransferase n=1 Tax=Halococcus sediminicola TaxID=1264579 RepID=UPI000B157384|nr:ThiF family adenylyltransferase [Halococcus sediminicola]
MPHSQITEAVDAIDCLSGVEVLSESEHYQDRGKWAVKVNLHPDGLADHPNVPEETIWYILLQETYPAGSIGICPADQEENTITATFPHQRLNSSTIDECPWRTGDICVARYGHTLNQVGAVAEPTEPDERLCWHMERALEWLQAASKGELREPDDPFEVPFFNTISSSGPTIAFNESQAGLDTWNGEYGQWGTVELRHIPTSENTYATHNFERDDEVVHDSDWGGYVGENSTDRLTAAWVLLEEIPISFPWETPECWGELDSLLSGTAVEAHELRASIQPVLEDESHKIVLLGFPIPQVVDGESEIIHWKPIEIPSFEDPQDLPGSHRRNSRGRELAERFRDSDERIQWLESDNWSHDQLTRRGHMNEWFFDCQIVLIGAGALGSAVAENLVRAGCRYLTVIDPDDVEIGNLARHTLSLADIGQGKATALSDRLESIAPYAQVTGIDEAFAPNTPMPAYLSEADVIVDCTASDAVRHALASLSWEDPVVFHSAAMGRRANRLYCFSAYERTFPYEEYDDAFDLWRLREHVEWDETADAVPERIGCWHPASVIRTDRVMMWAGQVTRVLDNAPTVTLQNPEFLVLETGSEECSWEVSQPDPPFENVITWNSSDQEETVQLPLKCVESMKVRCEKDHPNETGGIAAGSTREGRPALVVNAKDPPRDSIHSPTRFLRGTEEVEEWLRDARESIGLKYFGEWHYHPEQRPAVSEKDRDAMNEIAADRDYNCPHPLLFIMGEDESGHCSIAVYQFHRNSEYERLEQVEQSEQITELLKEGMDV